MLTYLSALKRMCFGGRIVLVAITFSLATTGEVRAGNATWSAVPMSGDWNNAGNWLPMTVPNSPTDKATFSSSSLTGVSASADVLLSDLMFSASTSAYTFMIMPKSELTIEGTIVNQSDVVQTIINVTDPNGPRGKINFRNKAAAGNSMTFINNGGTSSFLPTSWIIFYDSSTADGANIINGGSTAVGYAGGRTIFYDASFAGAAAVTAMGGTGGGRGGSVQFSLFSSADNATVVANGGEGGDGAGAIVFLDNSTAANATLVANGGLGAFGPGGAITFSDDATGGAARIKLFGNGQLFLGDHNAPLTVGSIEGDGKVFLGNNNLNIGSNNLSTTFSGVIHDNGSITKVGTGTTELSGRNSYKGGTVVESGGLLVRESSYYTGYGPVAVNNGAVFGGTGAVFGAVAISAGGRLVVGVPGTASGSLLIRNLTLNTGSIVQLILGPSSAHSTLDSGNGTLTSRAIKHSNSLTLAQSPAFITTLYPTSRVTR
jgi:autotransporter-associated beta strand protein